MPTPVATPDLLGLRIVNIPLLDLEGSPSASAAYSGEECEINRNTKWFAHIFSPSGRLLPSGQTKERYTIGFVDITNAEPVIAQANFQGQMVTHRISLLNLYRATGRVQAGL